MALLRRLKGENEHGGATFREKRSDLKKATLLNRGGGGVGRSKQWQSLNSLRQLSLVWFRLRQKADLTNLASRTTRQAYPSSQSIKLQFFVVARLVLIQDVYVAYLRSMRGWAGTKDTNQVVASDRPPRRVAYGRCPDWLVLLSSNPDWLARPSQSGFPL